MSKKKSLKKPKRKQVTPEEHLLPEEEYVLDPKWCVVNGDDQNHCILMLAGRSQRQNLLPSIYWHNGLQKYTIVGVTTTMRAWYPMPKGQYDQHRALDGIPHAIQLVDHAAALIQMRFGIPKSRIILLGFSAGGVVAIQAAAHSPEPYAGVICQSGAILDPKSLPTCQCKSTPFLLTHSKDDDAFEWGERYLPMKTTLYNKGYTLSVLECFSGGHTLTDLQIVFAKLFIQRCFRLTGETFLR